MDKNCCAQHFSQKPPEMVKSPVISYGQAHAVVNPAHVEDCLATARNWALRKSSIDPRKPTFARAEILEMAKSRPKIASEAPFKKPNSLKTWRSGPGQTLAGPSPKMKQRGDPYQRFFRRVFQGWVVEPANSWLFHFGSFGDAVLKVGCAS